MGISWLLVLMARAFAQEEPASTGEAAPATSVVPTSTASVALVTFESL
jgi:hypothetical protein